MGANTTYTERMSEPTLSLALAALLLFAACETSSGANYVFLYPKSKAEIVVDGTCRVATNQTTNALVWIPTRSHEAFARFSNYPGRLSLNPCKE